MRSLATHVLVPPVDRDEANRLQDALIEIQESSETLPGLRDVDHEDVLVAQLVESQRRTRYIRRLLDMNLSPVTLDGANDNFDPLKGAIVSQRSGHHDEACWLILLATHFGKTRQTGWRLAGDFYGRLGQGTNWDWPSTWGDVSGMRGWLDFNQAALRARGGRFGNHRKYESLNAWEPTGTGQVIATYLDWVGNVSHADRFMQIAPSSLTPRHRFAALYKAMGPVARFGRTARFDYLTTLAKIGLADIEPDSAHLSGATGPLAGARLLLDGHKNSKTRLGDLEVRLSIVQQTLSVQFDVLEDALCNWQKSPGRFIPFRG